MRPEDCFCVTLFADSLHVASLGVRLTWSNVALLRPPRAMELVEGQWHDMAMHAQSRG